jgi:hypothetical protein
LQFAQGEQRAGEDWFVELLTADQCGVFPPAQLDKILRQLQAIHGEDYGRALFLQEYYCSFDAAIPGSIWGDCVRQVEAAGRIVDFLVNPEAPVYTAWDLGRTDDTAIWWYQVRGRTLDVFDHHSSSLKDIPFYLALLEQKRVQYGITYARHALPHDARPRTLAAGGTSILQQCQAAAKAHPEFGTFQIGKRLDVQEGIQAARATFPHCRFHATRCADGLDALRQYHREYDEETKAFRDTPAHDWSSHSADAFRYLSLSWTVAKGKTPEAPFAERLLAGNITTQTLGALRAAHFKTRRADRAWSMTT